MNDIPPSASGSPDGSRLMTELLTINEEVGASGLEMERLARLPALGDSSVLSTARLRFSKALRRHLQHVDGAILPHLRTTADAKTNAIVDDYRRLLHDYHEAAAHHVANWPSTNVATNWDGYRKSVADMLARLRRRIEVERRDIHPLLADRDARAR